MEPFSITCPYCNHKVLIGDSNYDSDTFFFNMENKDGELALKNEIVVCPNPTCKEYIITAELYRARYQQISNRIPIRTWRLKPESSAKPLPDYIPKAIINDYEEACLIQNLSPKASATLSRRCLQGMIRDFWKETNGTLATQIKNIETKIDSVTWQAIDAVRKIGNIGAHMEKDIDLIIEVEPHEAELLISLIETLIEEWYINRHQREEKMKAITQLAQKKDLEKKQTV